MTSLNIGFIYCRNCAPGGRAQWVLKDTLHRIERLLELPNPQSFFAPMLEAGVLTEVCFCVISGWVLASFICTGGIRQL